MEITRVPGPQKESSELLGQQAELTHIDPQPGASSQGSQLCSPPPAPPVPNLCGEGVL